MAGRRCSRRTGRSAGARLAPAISAYATGRLSVSEIISGRGRRASASSVDPAAAATFLPHGHAPAPGDVFANPHLAATLRLIAGGGRDAFYKGPIAAAIAADMKQRNGLLDARDFADHSDWIEPIDQLPSRGMTSTSCPRHAGLLRVEMLNLLEGFDVKALGHTRRLPAPRRRSQAHRVRRSRRVSRRSPTRCRRPVEDAHFRKTTRRCGAGRSIRARAAASISRAGWRRRPRRRAKTRTSRAGIRTSIYMTVADDRATSCR